MNTHGNGLRVKWLHGDHATGLAYGYELGSDNKFRFLVLLDDGTFRTFEAEDLVDEEQAPVLDDDATRGEMAREDLDTLAEYLREHHGIDDTEPDEVDSAIALIAQKSAQVDELTKHLEESRIATAGWCEEVAKLKAHVAELEAALAEAKKQGGRKGSLLEKK